MALRRFLKCLACIIYYPLCDIYSLKLFFHIICKESGIFICSKIYNQLIIKIFLVLAKRLKCDLILSEKCFYLFFFSVTGLYVDFSILFVMTWLSLNIFVFSYYYVILCNIILIVIDIYVWSSSRNKLNFFVKSSIIDGKKCMKRVNIFG